MPTVTLLSEDGNTREGFVDPAELAALLVELRRRDTDVADAVEMAFCTCLRREAVLAAMWSWLRLDVRDGAVVGGELRLPSRKAKNKKPLALPLSGTLLALVGRRWALRISECEFMFHRAGRRIVDFRAAWKQACAAAGLSGLLFHDLRRSGARALRRAGVSEGVIMALGGWKTRSMFDRYNVTSDADLAAAMLARDAYVAAAPPRTVAPLRARKFGR